MTSPLLTPPPPLSPRCKCLKWLKQVEPAPLSECTEQNQNLQKADTKTQKSFLRSIESLPPISDATMSPSSSKVLSSFEIGTWKTLLYPKQNLRYRWNPYALEHVIVPLTGKRCTFGED